MDCFLKVKKLYQGKKVLILGLGIQDGGVEAVRFFRKLGCVIRVSDLRDPKLLQTALAKLKEFPDIEYEFLQHSPDFIHWAEIVVRNPGVPNGSPTLALARSLGKEILMPSAFLVKNCALKTIGITGTRGKSTTTNLIFEILNKLSPETVSLAGNLPQYSPFKIVSNHKAKTVVMELSSWELQGFREYSLSPQIAVLTNIYPDHLNYYSSMDEYIEDKLQIINDQKPDDWFVVLESVYHQFPLIKKYLHSQLKLVKDDYYQGNFEFLIGTHNRHNASLALAVGEILGFQTKDIEPVIAKFPGLPYRLEYLGTLKGAPVYNDTTSTTPVAGITALTALKEKYPDKKILAILGGNDKKLPFEEWAQTVNRLSDRIYLLPGTFSERVESTLDKHKLEKSESLPTLFEQVVSRLKPNTILLFSPSATSFATFKNEFDRGDQFNREYQTCLKRYGA